MAEKLHANNKLNKQKIEQHLSESVLSRLKQILIHQTTASTNDDLLELDPPAQGQFHVCVTDQQSHGRGRGGHLWLSPAGANVYLSLGGCLPVSFINRLGGLSLACGIIVARLLERYGLTPQVKWPNDIFIDHKKIAGLLIETRIVAESVYVVVGLGLNIELPEDVIKKINQPCTDMTTLLNLQSEVVERHKILAELIAMLIAGFEKFNQTLFESFDRDWKKYDMLKGKRVTVKTAEDEMDALVLGVNEDFSIQLDINGEKKHFYAADIRLKLGDYVNH